MGVDPRKRQKKLEKQKAKKKAERRELARQQSGGMPAHLKEAAAAPILHCVAADVLWEQGLGQVLVSRQLRSGKVAFVVFLVDRYCLGVKDLFMNILPKAEYHQRLYDKTAKEFSLVPLKPECARKLVEGAVEFAQSYGLPPPPDYRIGRLIFGDISAAACTEQFEYGKDGKPFYIQGPYDSPAKVERILRMLQEHAGSGGHHFFVSASDKLLEGKDLELLPLEDDEDGEDNEDNEDNEDVHGIEAD